MSWSQFWCKPIPSTPQSESSHCGDVRDELMFHFRELVNEKVTQGIPFDQAWEQAEKQFGPVRRYESECQAVQINNRMAWYVTSVAAAFLIIVCGVWVLQDRRSTKFTDELRVVKAAFNANEEERKIMGQQLAGQIEDYAREAQEPLRKTLQDGLAALRDERDILAKNSAQSAVELRQPQLVDLSGQVLDAAKQPLPDAKLLVILKTWPNGQYQQEDFTAISDLQGRFVLPKLIATESRFAIQVAAMKEGYAFQSYYHLKRLPIEKPEPITFELKPASPQTFVFRDQTGKPVSDVNVIPASRTPLNGNQFLVYFQGAESIQKTSGPDGHVSLNDFATNDTAEVTFQWPDGGWVTQKFQLTGQEVIVERSPVETASN